MSSYRERMHTEYDELLAKWTALDTFIKSDPQNVSEKHLVLLIEQEGTMFTYLNILEERIKLDDQG